MRLVSYVRAGAAPEAARAGRLEAGAVHDLGGLSALEVIERKAAGEAPSAGETLALDAVELLAPLPRPVSIRDFMAFEKHVKNARAARGQEVPRQWYEVPVFYFSNALAVRGPGEPVSAPPGSVALDLEFEVAIVIGKAGRDIPAARSWEHVFGLTIMNDWSARDLQAQEMPVMLGPAKGKDFATSLGPSIVTLDELNDRIEGEHLRLEMTARLNRDVLTTGNLADLHHSIPRMIARASSGVTLHPGEILGTGTLGGGCLLERQPGPYLQPGDRVELEVERLGVLASPVVTATTN